MWHTRSTHEVELVDGEKSYANFTSPYCDGTNKISKREITNACGIFPERVKQKKFKFLNELYSF